MRVHALRFVVVKTSYGSTNHLHANNYFAIILSQFVPYGRHALSHQHTMQGVTVLP